MSAEELEGLSKSACFLRNVLLIKGYCLCP
jgi:hypothetical protein